MGGGLVVLMTFLITKSILKQLLLISPILSPGLLLKYYLSLQQKCNCHIKNLSVGSIQI